MVCIKYELLLLLNVFKGEKEKTEQDERDGLLLFDGKNPSDGGVHVAS